MIPQTLDELRKASLAGPPYTAAFLNALRGDVRAGAQALLAQCLARLERDGRESARMAAMDAFEAQARANGFRRIAGIDEAGRGPLAGPVVAGAVILTAPVAGLNDSKQLSEEQRERLYEELKAGGHAVGVAVVSAEVIDRIGIQAANYRAMAEAAAAIAPPPDFLLVDGFRIPGLATPQERIVKGDRRSASIAAASIIAKVTRDRMMLELEERYPGYGFARHKGYGTQEHLAALARLGPCPEHRRSFAPLSKEEDEPLLF